MNKMIQIADRECPWLTPLSLKEGMRRRIRRATQETPGVFAGGGWARAMRALGLRKSDGIRPPDARPFVALP